MSVAPSEREQLSPQTREFYRHALRALKESGHPFLVGGAYAFRQYTDIVRHTKDIDVFIRPPDLAAVLRALAALGCQTEVTYPHWLAKAFRGDDFVDVIFNTGNGIAPVDDDWLTHSVAGEVVGEPVRLCAPEEMIWSKAFTMERDRYDGADVAHLLRACADRLDWDRLVSRFGPYWRVLLSHFILFGFAFPGEQGLIPARVLDGLLDRLRAEAADPPADERLCRGMLLAGGQYLIDVERWGYQDARRQPWGTMTADQVVRWREGVRRERARQAEKNGVAPEPF